VTIYPVKEVVLIAALDANNGIGKDNDIPWRKTKELQERFKEDMALFQAYTLNQAVIMGRKTYESIPPKFRPLKERINIVVLSQSGLYTTEPIFVQNSLQGALTKAHQVRDIAFLAGGGQIYQEALQNNFVDRMYLSHLKDQFECDTFFPQFDKSQWNVSKQVDHNSFIFREYVRKR
jgi:dihydrofolate reductase